MNSPGRRTCEMLRPGYVVDKVIGFFFNRSMALPPYPRPLCTEVQCKSGIKGSHTGVINLGICQYGPGHVCAAAIISDKQF